MLQVTLDPCLLTSIGGATTPANLQLALSLTGVFWDVCPPLAPPAPADPFNCLPPGWLTSTYSDATTTVPVKNVLYPWNWDYPEKIRLYWYATSGDKSQYNLLRAADHSPLYTEVALGPAANASYADDGKSLTAFYTDVLDGRLWPAGEDGKRHFNPYEILWSAADQGTTITDNTDGSIMGVNTGFLKTTVAHYAQKAAPLNQYLKLTFLEAGTLTPPTGATHFAAFPIGGNWWAPDVNANLPDNTTNFLQLQYKPVSWAGSFFGASCTLSPLTYPADTGTPIILRDQNGNFLGNVNLKVCDVKDWAPAVVGDLGPFFWLPDLLLAYLNANKALLQLNGNTPPSATGLLLALGDFLWAVIRDGLGYGFYKGSDNTSVVDKVARQLADDHFPSPVQQLSNADQVRYWDFYNKTSSDLYILLPQADKIHFPDLPTWKTFVTGLNDPTIQPLLAGLGPTGLPATNYPPPQQNFPARIDLDGWLTNWAKFINAFRNTPAIQSRVMATQWDALGQPNTNEGWYEKVFSGAGDLRSLQLEAISELYKGTILQSTGASAQNVDPEVLAKDSLTAIKAFSNARISPQSAFYPATTDPFVNPPAELTTPPDWKGFMAWLDSGLTVKSVLQAEINQTSNIVPPLTIAVDVLDIPAQQGPPNVDDSDAQNEIAGHVLLMQREDSLGQKIYIQNSWRHLNWVLLQTHQAAGDIVFKNSYVIPAYLPEIDGRRQPGLELTNEKLSLIAGHDAYTDADSGDEPSEDVLRCLFDPHVDANGKTDHVGYALWYGWNYRFASFVALNSGILPQAIRDGAWNLPAMAPALNGHQPLSLYQHLRRVPVSTVRVNAVRMVASGSSQQAMPVIQPPAGLQPLAFELPGWKDNTVIHYLLTDTSLAAAAYQQNQVSLQLRRPTTSFWNWYAWLGSDANTPVPGQTPAKSYAQMALEQELVLRDKKAKDPNFNGEGHLCDPAAGNTFVIVVQTVFPTLGKFTAYDVTVNSVTFLNDPYTTLKVQLVANLTADWLFTSTTEGGTLQVKPGVTVRVDIYPTVDGSLFWGNAKAKNPKFFAWMQNAMAAPVDATVQLKYPDAVFTKPVELFFEAALPPVMDHPQLLWKALWVDSQADDVYLHIRKDKNNYVPLAYFSQLEVRHQVWSWNGRLNKQADWLTSELLDPQLDPDSGLYVTSDAMKWEAWAFSDRPDISALVQNTNLLAFSPFSQQTAGPNFIDQLLFTDTRPQETKALYFRFNVTAHSRYELLGPGYRNTVLGCILIDNALNGWVRYLRKCSRTAKLPKPSIRFILPLTKTIDECIADDEISAASLLIVLNDRWYTEAGLAEQLELGVDIVADPRDGVNQSYLDAGIDPILSGAAMTAVIDPTLTTTTFPVRGPVGLTFDFAAQTPGLTSSAFIVPLPDLTGRLVTPGASGGNMTLEPWSLMQVAVRRTLVPELCEAGIAVESSFSEWSSKEWVQFVPATDSFIPASWREAVQQSNYVTVSVPNGGKTFTVLAGNDLPAFDSQRMQFFLVVTQKVYDIGGQPVERYVATWQFDAVSGQFMLDGPPGSPWDGSVTEGYLRLMLVRTAGTPAVGDQIWNRLFGRNADPLQQPNATLVADDPTAALPLVSERIPFRV